MINQSPKYRRRRRVAALVLLLILGLVAAGIYLVTRSSTEEAEIPEPQTPPLSYDGFQIGNIISNQNFSNYQSMTAEQIQAFLTDWGYGCRPGSTEVGQMENQTGASTSSIAVQDGKEVVPCLKDFRGLLETYPADSYCLQEVQGGDNLSAGEIIYRISQSCQINPQSLLVTLQKEQGLITASSKNLTPTRYRSAMGYACPDNQNCDSQFYGFSKQVYYAARQFQRYRRDSTSYDYQAQGYYQIRNGPAEECGTSEVKIENWASAGLYNYTPYAPTQNSLLGVFDECNQAGNLNFYAYFKAWFGDPIGEANQILTRTQAFPTSSEQSSE